MYNADTTPKAPRQCKYIIYPPYQRMQDTSEANEGCIQYTPWGVPVALFLTNRWSCEVLRMSKPKRTVTPFMYICPPNLCPSGLPVWYRQYKSNIFTLKATSFGWQSMIFKVQFNIIKHKNVKEIHFCIIILAGKFVLSMNTYIFTATVSAILSNTLTEVLQYSYVSTGQISRKYRNNIPKTDTRVLFPCHQTWAIYILTDYLHK